MERFKEIDFKSNISFFYTLEKHIKTETKFFMDNSVSMCWVEDNPVFLEINQFIDKITTVLDCKHSRSCYTVQSTLDSHLPVHIDKDDSLVGIEDIHNDIYSLIIPISGSAVTKFYKLHKDDHGPNKTNIDDRYKIYISDSKIYNKLKEHSSSIIEKPTILNISYPHSVQMTQAPRITYHVKLLQCKYDINQIQEKLNKI